MSAVVDPSEIEQIVGVERHATEHFGRLVAADWTVYILHSRECRTTTEDLRTCRFSVALDRGIADRVPSIAWTRLEDRAVPLRVWGEYLVPDVLSILGAAIEPIIGRRRP